MSIPARSSHRAVTPGRRARAVGAALIILVVSACSGDTAPDLELADWIIPVGDGVPIHEYLGVAVDERDPDAVRLVEDLVIGADPNDPNTLFYQPTGIWASAGGDIFVAEMGGKRVQMFDADGRFVRTIGKEGQGPGEFQFPFFIMGGGDRFGVYDMRNRRISSFSDNGDHLGDVEGRLSLYTNLVASMEDGSFVATTNERNPDRSSTVAITRFSFEGDKLATLAEVEGPPVSMMVERDDPVGQAQALLDRRAYTPPLKAAGEGIVYVSPASQYQVLAMTPDGDPRWALRVAWPRPPYPPRLKRAFLESRPEEQADFSEEALDWPEDEDAVQAMFADGAGRLYVLPGFEQTGDEAPERFPIDVYSPDGERIAAGIVSNRWSFARGEYVYGFGFNNDDDQTTVVRYRILLGG